jgi:DNA (cytosine-5)-methyltransferase 1
MARPRLLDLFCGAGGAAMGYHRAGFDVVGVDNRPQPRYPFEFIQADALAFIDSADLSSFAIIHASPPCHDHSAMSTATGSDGTGWLLAAVRDWLLGSYQARPWVLENTERADLPGAWVLCGTQFGLRVRRHRKFEVHPGIAGLLPPCICAGRVAKGELVGHRLRGRVAPGRTLPPPLPESARREAIGVPWMTCRSARQAIPPAYTEYIGRRLLEVLRETPPEPLRAGPRGEL